MKIGNPGLSSKVALYVSALLKDGLRPEIVFHNLEHTSTVVRTAIRMARHLHLDSRLEEILLTAAWFHDTGFIVDYEHHKENSQAFARGFLMDHWSSDKIDLVCACIGATTVPQRPVGILQNILCDADLQHLSSPYFFRDLYRLRLERETALKQNYSDADWYESNLAFMRAHRYFTDYARKTLEPGKKENIRRLEQFMVSARY